MGIKDIFRTARNFLFSNVNKQFLVFLFFLFILFFCSFCSARICSCFSSLVSNLSKPGLQLPVCSPLLLHYRILHVL